MTPLMGSSAPSAHSTQEIHKRGVPSPLRSAFTVGSVLTVYSLPGLVGLFHPTALMGFRVEPLRALSAFAGSTRPVFDRSAALRSSSTPPEGDGSELDRGSPEGETRNRIGQACHRSGRPGPRLRLPHLTTSPKTRGERADGTRPDPRVIKRPKPRRSAALGTTSGGLRPKSKTVPVGQSVKERHLHDTLNLRCT